MINKVVRLLCIIFVLGTSVIWADELYETLKDPNGQSLFWGEVSAQGGVLEWFMTLGVEQGVQTMTMSLRGEPMGRQSRSAVITHGTRQMTDRIKRYLNKNPDEESAAKREQVNQAQDFLEETLREILNAPRMSDLKKAESAYGRKRKKFPPKGINVDIAIKGAAIYIINHDEEGKVYSIAIPADAPQAFVEEMRSDVELGKYVRRQNRVSP